MSSTLSSTEKQGFRPPAVPLITVDPYFSIWSMADKLTDDPPRHWTGVMHGMCGMIVIDGKVYRYMSSTPGIKAMEQIGCELNPTRSIYTFQAGGVRLITTFITPLLMDDLDIMSRPASYVDFQVESLDEKEHDIKLYMDVPSELTVDTPDQKVVWGRHKLGGDQPLQLLRVGSKDQPVLEKSGDNLRIDWGYLYLVVSDAPGYSSIISMMRDTRSEFANTGVLRDSDDLDMPKKSDHAQPAMACVMDLGKVGPKPVSRFLTLVYDDIFPIEYLNRKLRAYWRRNGMTINELIRAAVKDYPTLRKRCETFDKEMMADAEKCGGKEYAEIAAVSYRQAIAAHKLAVDTDGRGMFFSKENFSNGCIATVDVSYPSSPMFLLFNTDLFRAMLEPMLEYSASKLWPHDFAPHDLGTYPLANGQVYGSVDVRDMTYQMPVEESGNMLVMLGALSHIEGNASYAGRWWDLISKWAAYLKDKGMDPENQLCTDDFMGHLAHNTNLSIKAITGIACYAKMADMLGKKDVASDYRKTAEEMAAKWKEMATEGDHYKLAFDQSGTWSQKYNLVWDKLLGLNLFDPSIAAAETASYLKRQNTYGLPLDNRGSVTKGDWIVWTATLAENDSDFQALISPLRKFLDESPTRAPFGDRHDTKNGKAVGFRARSVVGGVFVKMLSCPGMWEKWCSK